MTPKEYKQELKTLLSYNKLSEQELINNRMQLNQWYQDEVNANLMFQNHEDLPVDLRDGLVYTLDLNNKLTCHGFKPEFRTYLLKEDLSKTDLVIIADELAYLVYPDVKFSGIRVHKLYLPFLKDGSINYSAADEVVIEPILYAKTIIAPSIEIFCNSEILWFEGEELHLSNLRLVSIWGLVETNYQRIIIPDKPILAINENAPEEEIDAALQLCPDTLIVLFNDMRVENLNGCCIEPENKNSMVILNEHLWDKLSIENGNGYAVMILNAKEVSLPNCSKIYTDCLRDMKMEKLDLNRCNKLAPRSIQNCPNLREIDLRNLWLIEDDYGQTQHCEDFELDEWTDPICDCPKLSKLILSEDLKRSAFSRYMKKKHGVRIEYVR